MMLRRLPDWESSDARSPMIHRPVLVRETLAMLRPERGGIFVDCTLGLGGHAEALLEASDRVRVIGFDRDAEAIELAQQRLDRFSSRCEIFHADFKEMTFVLSRRGITQVDGILADLGVSSLQLETAERGFSFEHEGPLDMRMDRRQSLTAADLVNRLSEDELADILFRYGEEPAARAIARAIVRARAVRPIVTTTDLARLVATVVGRRASRRIHPATRTFQALRIAVNDELSGLEEFLDQAVDLLAVGGRLVVITFHSLEDRIVKRRFRFHAGLCDCPPLPPGFDDASGCPLCGARRRVELLTRKAVRPSETELQENPRARSARLRACVRVGER